jgi:hypothetical protein
MAPATQKQVFFLVALVFAALCVFSIARNNVPAPLNAQDQPAPAPENSIMVIPVQLDRDTHGLAMIDTATQTLWIYKLDNRGYASNRLELFAARSWQYDKLLQSYNTAEPKPEQVKILLESLAKPKDSEKPKNINLKLKDVDDKTGDVNNRPKDVNKN